MVSVCQEADDQSICGVPSFSSVASSSSLSEGKQQGTTTPTISSPRMKLLSKLGLPATKEEESDGTPKNSTLFSKTQGSFSCIIFDWDDTLFCTSHKHSGRRLSSTDIEKLDDAGAKILKAALELGMTKIVTNAATGWVESTAQKHLPQVYAILPQIEVISARDQFKEQHPNDPVTWKVEAFCAIKQDSKAIANLTAIGDSEAEMVAIREMAKLYDIAFFKAVKMKADPTCQELHKELKLLNGKLQQIVHGAKNYNINLFSRPT